MASRSDDGGYRRPVRRFLLPLILVVAVVAGLALCAPRSPEPARPEAVETSDTGELPTGADDARDARVTDGATDPPIPIRRSRDHARRDGVLDVAPRIGRMRVRVDGDTRYGAAVVAAGRHEVRLEIGRWGETHTVGVLPGETVVVDASAVLERAAASRQTRCECRENRWGRAGVDTAIDWLARHQEDHGGFSAETFVAACGEARCDPAAKGHNDVETTGLVVLALLGFGETHFSGQHHNTMWSALRHLKGLQRADGAFDSTDVRTHAVATLAMCEAYGLTGSRLWKPSAQRSVAALAAMRSESSGWPSTSGGRSPDLETTVWAACALHAARVADLNVDLPEPPLVDLRALGSPSGLPYRDAVLLAGARIALGETLAGSPDLAAAANRVAAVDPASGRTMDPTAAYFSAIVAVHSPDADADGEVDQEPWLKAFRDPFTTPAARDTDPGHHDCGSWTPQLAAQESEGRLRTTALLTLAAEIAFRYGRVFGANRD